MQAAVRSGVMLVDEAGLLGTRDMGRLFDIARDGGCRVVLVGDKRQHRSVSAGEPLRLLEERAGCPVAEVTEIMRQDGDYRRAARALSEGRTAEGFAELDRLRWIKEVPDNERYQALAAAYLAATNERKKNGEQKTALVVSPTHAEANRITDAIRAALKEQKRIRDERVLDTWVPAQMTDAQKTDATAYEPGDMLRFHQNAPGHKSGSRLVVAAGQKLPLARAERFEVYRPSTLAVAVNDRLRVTANGKTKDGKHTLTNGSILTVRGFTKEGDPIVDHGWVIAKDWGHLAHGYCVTSHASQGKTVDKVFVGLSSQSFPAATQRSFYVPVTRGREQALVFTDSKADLFKAVQRKDEPMSATELAQLARHRKRAAFRERMRKHLAFVRRREEFERVHPAPVQAKTANLNREHDYER
jgi:ATP-dependent exoDNAse (exonuclease V) alpha subunit